MKKLFFSLLLSFVAVFGFSQTKVPYAVDTVTTHDTSTLVKVLKTQPYTHDTLVKADSIRTISVTHDTLVKRKFRPGFKTVSTTHDSGYLVSFRKNISTTHDTSFYANTIKIVSITHDTIVIRYRVATTTFGASGPTIDAPTTLKFICPNKNGKSVTRSAIVLKSYSGGGSNEADKYLAAGCVVFININWDRPQTINGDKIGVPFPTDIATYKAKLKLVFDYYKNNPNRANIIFVCENEPTNTDMHSGPMSDYGIELTAFGQMADSYGFKWTDGGVHVDTVLGINLDADHEGSSGDAGKLLDIYSTLPTMYAVNMHTSNARSDSYNSQRIVDAVNKVKQHTGHNVVSNEWHSQYQTTTSVLLAMCKGWYDADVEYSVYISGTGDPTKNNPLNDVTTLTIYGISYKNFIQTH